MQLTRRWRHDIPRSQTTRMAEDQDGRQNIGDSAHNSEPSYGRIKAESKHELSNKKLCSKTEEEAAIQF